MPPKIAERVNLIARRAQTRAKALIRAVANLFATSCITAPGSAVLAFQHFIRATALTALPGAVMAR